MKIFRKLSTSTLIALTIIFVGVFVFLKFVVKADTAPQLLSTLGVDNTQVRPDQDFQYTVTIKNTGSVPANNILVSLNLNSNMTYVVGSGSANKEGKTVNVVDSWTTTGTNLGSLNSGKVAYLFFRAKVNDNAVVGSSLQSAVQVKADGVDWTPTAFSINVISSNLTTTLLGGNFVKVTNVTQASGWQDGSVNAELGNIIEYDINITNTGDQVAKNVHFRADLPGQSQKSNVLHPTITLSADNASNVSDSVTVNVNFPTWMEYYPGHAKKFGNTGLYDCGDTVNGCPIPETFYYNAENIGDVQPGESKTIQVGFKSLLVNLTTPTPTSTPTPTPTPTPTQTPAPNPISSCQNLNVTATSGTRPLTITFTGSGTDSNGSVQQYQFNFGDSSNGQDQIVTTGSNQASHVYNNAGNFTANLLVKDSRGNWVGGGNCQVNINVNNPPTVLGTTAPTALPKTGSDDGVFVIAASIPAVFAGIFLYRKFRLI